VWESVRPVPTVRIDFGNGTELTRTLHGNIATSVCTAEGQVLDILPGIYQPGVYLDRLNQLALLARYVQWGGKTMQGARLHNYHTKQAEALRKSQVPLTFVKYGSDMSKRGIEIRLESILAASSGVKKPVATTQTTVANLALASLEDVANWKELAADTEQNELSRRLQIHEALAKSGMVRPAEVTKWVYKEVLHADLDDPYLGLGNLLFASYPFKDKP
jgi:hypothetical protein